MSEIEEALLKIADDLVKIAKSLGKDKPEPSVPEWVVGHLYKDRAGKVLVLSDINNKRISGKELLFFYMEFHDFPNRVCTGLDGKYICGYGDHDGDIIEKIDISECFCPL